MITDWLHSSVLKQKIFQDAQEKVESLQLQISQHLLANHSSHQRLPRHRARTSLRPQQVPTMAGTGREDAIAAELPSQKAALRSSRPHSKQQKSHQADIRAADREALASHPQHIVCRSRESMAGSQERERTMLVI